MKYSGIYSSIMSMLFFAGMLSCKGDSECKTVKEWKVGEYTVVKLQCPDMVLAHYYQFEIFVNGVRRGSVTQIDSCRFGWQETNEVYRELNICANSSRSIKAKKVSISGRLIDSIKVRSKAGETWTLNKRQVSSFIDDWNGSTPRSYSNMDFDSAFNYIPAYEYRLTIFSGSGVRDFYLYNYLVLDSSGWEFEAGKQGEKDYYKKFLPLN